MAIPNYARTNRDPAPPPEPPRPAEVAGVAPQRPAPRPVTSTVWIKEA
jgi:hypothetical protein